MIEEAYTEPWIFDHMISHLRNAGLLKVAKGVLVSECHECVPAKHNPGYYSDRNLEEILEYYLRKVKHYSLGLLKIAAKGDGMHSSCAVVYQQLLIY